MRLIITLIQYYLIKPVIKKRIKKIPDKPDEDNVVGTSVDKARSEED